MNHRTAGTFKDEAPKSKPASVRTTEASDPLENLQDGKTYIRREDITAIEIKGGVAHVTTHASGYKVNPTNLVIFQ